MESAIKLMMSVTLLEEDTPELMKSEFHLESLLMMLLLKISQLLL